nr:unnamed protein product [Callosobruchus analis]
MPNRHVEEVLEEQTRQLNIASRNCMKQYGSSVADKLQIPFYNETTKTFMCPPFWDTILCWPPTPPGDNAILPCPSYIAGFKTMYNATRYCTENSTWFINEKTNVPWADYTSCSEGIITTIFVPAHKADVSPKSEVILPAIKVISQTGYAVSLLSLIIAFLIMLLIKKLHCARNILHMNLFGSFIMRAFFYILKDVLFVDGIGLWYDLSEKNGELYFNIDTMTNNYECKLLTSLVQYFTTANYAWILIEGVYLNNLIFRALLSDSSKNLVHYICLGWGLPLLVVVPWIVARVILDDTMCWTTNDNFMAFMIITIPTVISVLINLVLFVIISIVLYAKLRSPMNEDTKRYQKWAKSTLVLVPLFGVLYGILLIFYFAGMEDVWLVCDTLFGSFQGFFVAILYCFLNGEVKTEIKPYLYSGLSYLAMHRIFRYCFPCRERYLRSAVGRQSVCTTMSCSSLYANGVVHRNSKSKWDMYQKGKQNTIEFQRDHFCNAKPMINLTKNKLQILSSNKKFRPTSGGVPKTHVSFTLY